MGSDVLLALGGYFLAMLGTFLAVMPLEPATMLAVKYASPWLVAAVATLAAGLTSAFDWHFVRRVYRMGALERLRKRPLVQKAERAAKVAPFWTIFTFALIPLPFVIIRILMPLSGYPLGRYVGAVCLGRYPRILAIAYLGEWIAIPTPVLLGVFGVAIVFALSIALARRFGWLPKGPEDEEPAPPPTADSAP